MPMPSERVRVEVGGRAHDDWESYEIDSDLLIPADAWSVSVGLIGGDVPADVFPGQPVAIFVGDDQVMTGAIDDITHVVSKDRRDLHVAGRDRAALLVDCSAPVFTRKQCSLDEVITAVVRALGITKYEIRAGDVPKARRREKINVEPGDSAWSVLSNAAEALGLWPWFEPDGTLVVGGPDYAAPPVATLLMYRSETRRAKNNMISLTQRENVAGRYSHLTVLGQTHGTDAEQGKHALKYTAVDEGMPVYRPRIVIDHEADTPAICASRARKLIADTRLKGFTLSATVAGHRINAPGQPGHGTLWRPGMRVRVISEPHYVNGVYFLMARKFTGGREQAPRTLLTLKEDKAWVLDAHPHKNRHRRGKNEAALQIPDLTKGAAQ